MNAEIAWLRRTAPLLPATGLLTFLFLIPVLGLLALSVLSSDGGLSLEHYRRLFATKSYVDSLGTTLKISTWTALLSVGLGYPLAYFIARQRLSIGGLLMLGVLIPYWSGVLLRTFAWLVLLGRRGPVNGTLTQLGIVDAPVQFLFHTGGVLLGMVNAYVPIAVLLMTSAMQSIDRRLETAAATMGAGAAQSFWRVYLPLSMPGVAAALLLVFISSLGTFITPALLGSGREVMIAQVIIDQVEQLLNWGFAGAVAMLLLVVTLAVFILFNALFGASALLGRGAAPRMTRLGRLSGAAGRAIVGTLGSAFDRIEALLPQRPAQRRGGNFALAIVALAVLAVLIVPALFLVPISFTGGSFMEWPPRNFSLRWYEMVLTSDQWLRAAIRSLVVGIATALLSVLIGLPAAMAFTRGAFRGRTALLGFVLSPMIIPHILIAVALFYLFARTGLVGTNLGLILGHTVVCLPYTVIALMAVLSTYDRRLDQAADTLGASTWQRVWLITLPLIRPGLAAAFLIAFVTSFEELTIAMFVTGGLTATLPKQLWSEMLMAASPALAAVSTVMLVFISAVIVFAYLLRSRASAGGGAPNI